MTTSRFSFPTAIHMGPGVRSKALDLLKERGLKRPMIVTDRGVAGQIFFKDFAKSFQKDFRSSVFSEIWGNPVKTQVVAGVVEFKKGDCDSIVGIGGGAALDVAKAIALMATHSGDLFDYEDEKPGAKPIDDRIPYWIALPTTAGTGSEVGRSSVVSDDKTHVKKIIFSPYLLAKVVLADPELTVGLPGPLTAATGMDAITHLVEAFLAKGYHPICDGIAIEGLRLASINLPICMKDPKNLEARANMLMASMMGAVAFQKGLGLVHSCAHALSTVADLHHGLANGIMIDHALTHNIEAVPERFERMAECVGLPNKSPASFLNWLTKLKEQVGIPAKLSGSGVKKEQKEALANQALADGCHLNNPRPCSKGDFSRIFEDSL